MVKQKKKDKQKNAKSKADKNVSEKLPKHLTLNPDMPSEHFGLDFFHFWNGDTYVGNYKATINKKLTKEGNGKYFTNDGSSYDGVWVNDELLEALKINFKDGTSYKGHLLNGQFNGQGVYSVPGIGTFSCSFVEGKPVGVVLFDDVNNNKWQGNVDSSGIIIQPKNHFFYSEVVIEESVKSRGQQDVIVKDITHDMEEADEEELKTHDNNVPTIHVIESVN